ncbi:hypothetical protein TNCV_3459791 [Trichonephila clavipes]|nr:hypothetical protein TNCV_3459791 [Trichonephila clavipes]
MFSKQKAKLRLKFCFLVVSHITNHQRVESGMHTTEHHTNASSQTISRDTQLTPPNSTTRNYKYAGRSIRVISSISSSSSTARIRCGRALSSIKMKSGPMARRNRRTWERSTSSQ